MRVNKTISREEEATVDFPGYDDEDNVDDQVNNNNHQSSCVKSLALLGFVCKKKEREKNKMEEEKGSVSLVSLSKFLVNVDRIPFGGRKKRK